MPETEEETFTLEQAYAVVLGNATAEGRCPHCGRRHDDDHEKTFTALREEVAAVRTERDEVSQRAIKLEDQNLQLTGEVGQLIARLKETASEEPD